MQLRGSLCFMLYGNKQSALIPLTTSPVTVNGIGLCSAGARFLLCKSAFRPQSDLVAIRILQNSPTGAKATTEGLSRAVSYSPFPADLSVDPLDEFFSPRLNAISEVRVDVLEPIAYVERNFEISNVRLHDFVASSRLTAMASRWNF